MRWPHRNINAGGIPKERLKLASGVFNLTRNLGGAIGIALCGSILNNRTNFHFSRMGEKMVSVPHTVNDFISRSALFLIAEEVTRHRKYWLQPNY